MKQGTAAWRPAGADQARVEARHTPERRDEMRVKSAGAQGSRRFAADDPFIPPRAHFVKPAFMLKCQAGRHGVFRAEGV